MPSKRLLPIVREGYPFIWVGIGLILLTWVAGWDRLAALLFLLTVFVITFFRDPDRKVSAADGEILSPADGRILIVEEVDEVPHSRAPTNARWQKVSIFMSIFNVHVNRVPMTGRVKKIRYSPGRFLMGFSEKASLENEHNATLIEEASGKQVMLVQIAGLIARRIVSHLSEGDSVKAGDRFGMIRFGSRCDLYFSPEAEVIVVPGDRVKAGLHTIARFSSPRGKK